MKASTKRQDEQVGIENDEFCIKMMNSALDLTMMNSVFQMSSSRSSCGM